MTPLELAQDPNTHLEVLIQLVTDTTLPAEVRSSVAQNPTFWEVENIVTLSNIYRPPYTHKIYSDLIMKAPISCMIKIILHDDISDDLKIYALRHPLIPQDLLTALFSNFDWRMRQAVAKHPNCSPDLILKIAKDPHSSVREALLQSPDSDCPANVLEALRYDSEHRLRYMVARHKNTPIKILEEYSKDESYIPLILHNPQELSKVIIQRILYAIKSNSDTFHKGRWQNAFAKRSDLSLSTIQRMITDPGYHEGLAQNSSCPAQYFELFSESNSASVRLALAQNTETPVHFLEKLSRDGTIEVLEAVASHSNTSGAVLIYLCQLKQITLERAILKHPLVPLECLNFLATHSQSDILKSVFKHPSATPEIKFKAQICLMLEHGIKMDED